MESSSLRKHEYEKHEIGYKCGLCNDHFSSCRSLTKHAMLTHKDQDLLCALCNASYQSPQELRTHLLARKCSVKKEECLSCGKRFNLPTQLISHRHKAHGAEISCNLCHQVFNNVVSLRSHKVNKHTGKDKICEICGYSTKKTHDFKRHQVSKHTNNYSFKCKLCDKGFYTQYEFNEHQNVHTMRRPYQCELCGMDYSRRSSLVLHRARKHPETFDASKRCPVCNAVYLNKDTLTAHIAMHSEGRKRYHCDICGKGLLSRAILKIHQRSHTGEKPFDCSYCGRAFSCKKNLSVHIRLHTGERPYTCRFCWKSYTKSSALKTHEKIHCRDGKYIIFDEDEENMAWEPTLRKTSRRDLTMTEKLIILRKFDSLPENTSHYRACKILNISSPILWHLVKNRKSVEEIANGSENCTRKRKRSGKDPKVEEALKNWYYSARETKGPLSGAFMREKAEQLAQRLGNYDFRATEGWFNRWKKRENIQCTSRRQQRGLNIFVDLVTHEWLTGSWPDTLSRYPAEAIYTVSETTLYYQAIPEVEPFLTLKDQNQKTKNERVTILCCTSLTGVKEELVVVGNYKKMQPSEVGGQTPCPVDYYYHPKAMMTSILFCEWLKKWDKRQTKKILLLAEQSDIHVPGTLLKLDFVNFSIIPTGITPIIYDRDLGLSRVLKENYRLKLWQSVIGRLTKSFVVKSLEEYSREIDVTYALNTLAVAWDKISPKHIRQNYKRSGFSWQHENLDGKDGKEKEKNQRPVELTPKQYEEWLAIDLNVPPHEILAVRYDDDY